MLWPLVDGSVAPVGIFDTATSSFDKTITADAATVNIKGPWTELFASVPFDVSAIYLQNTIAIGVNASTSQVLLDIGIGASGSELVIVSNIAYGRSGVNKGLFIPVRIPKNTRIAIRIQSDVLSKAVEFLSFIFPANNGFVPFVEGYSRVVTYGDDTLNSKGTTLTVPTATHTEGAWTEIVASTSESAKAILLSTGGATNATVLAASTGGIDLGIGAFGSEQPIISDIPWVTTAGEVATSFYPFPVPMQIAAGSRLCARYRASSTGAANAPSVCLHLFR